MSGGAPRIIIKRGGLLSRIIIKREDSVTLFVVIGQLFCLDGGYGKLCGQYFGGG